VTIDVKRGGEKAAVSKGSDFSRAAKARDIHVALATEGMFPNRNRLLSTPSLSLYRLSLPIKNIFSKADMFFDHKIHHTKTTQITTIYHQFTTFYQPKTTSKSPYPQTLAL
jgi:hypothetical protein